MSDHDTLARDFGQADLGDPGECVFTRVERDELGEPVACFVTADAASFALGRQALELRIEWLEKEGRGSSEERRALRRLRG